MGARLFKFYPKFRSFIGLSLFLTSFSVFAGGEYVDGEIIVKLKSDQVIKGSTKAFSGMANKLGLSLKGSWKSMNLHHYKATSGSDVEALVKEIESDPAVEFAEPNYKFNKASLTSFSNEASLSEMQEAFASSGSRFTQTSAHVDAEDAWSEMSSAGIDTVVAVIDTGLDMDHPSFTKLCAIWNNEAEINGTPGIDDDRNGYVDDFHGWNFVANTNSPEDDDGHGTHVSGIVLGSSIDILNLPKDSAKECVGDYQAKIKIMPLKFLDGNGSGATSNAIQAIYYAVNNGARILNNSWGGGSYSRALHEAVAYSYSRKALFVAAAGNAGSDNDSTPMFPSSYDVPNVISVAATSSSDYKASFSNYGAFSVHLGSPGVAIYSTIPGSYYGTMSGTSMAAPFVAGLAAMISREQPSMYGYQIKDIINSESDSISNLSNYTVTGKRLNFNDAMVSAKAASVWSEQPSYDISLSLYDREVASALASSGAGCGLVKQLYRGNGGGPGAGGGGGLSRFFMLFAIMIPAGLWLAMRRKKEEPGFRREHERYKVDSKVKLNINGREVEGSMASISMGGAGVNVEQLLDMGSVVTLKIQSPDGSGEIEVDGHIVWSDGEQSHGIRFASTADRVKSLLGRWIEVVSGA